MAIENRLDLAAEKNAVEALAQALDITVDWRWVGHVEVGISTERPTRLKLWAEVETGNGHGETLAALAAVSDLPWLRFSRHSC